MSFHLYVLGLFLASTALGNIRDSQSFRKLRPNKGGMTNAQQIRGRSEVDVWCAIGALSSHAGILKCIVGNGTDSSTDATL